MTGARQEVLERIRRALGDRPAPPRVERTYRAEGRHVAGSPALVPLLADRLRDYRATVTITDPVGLAEAIASALGSAGTCAVPPGVPAGWTDAWRAKGGRVLVDDRRNPLTLAILDGIDAVLTGARLAIAETGTIVLDAAADQGRRVLTLVPDHHVCVVRVDQVVESVPEAVALLETARPQTWISGPSATSDIELERVEGVHGPRTLDVILVA